MSAVAEYSVEEGDGGRTLRLDGPYLVSTIGRIDQDLRKLDGPFERIDLSGVTSIDTVGAWTASHLAREHHAQVVGGNERAERLMTALDPGGESNADIHRRRDWFWERVALSIGEMMFNARKGIVGVLTFLGGLIVSAAGIVRHPSRFRGKALVRQMELVGVAALPIVGLMSFLIGIVIAQQGAVQLAQFGAETLTINLVGRITLRELGVLMTAIMVAGRSGSAFAAQIGTMQLTEEVDAMRTIGISPMEALIIPRILACTLMMVVLGFYAMVMAILGGAVVSDLTLGIPFLNFIERLRDVVPIYDLWVGLVKAPVFGLIIGLAGCYQGMQVKGNSEDVGRRTTKAVVSAIFAVIVLDAFFAVFFTQVGWA